MASPALSIVVPVFNEAEVLPRLRERLVGVLEEAGESFELLLVDDGSTDGSLALMLAMHQDDPRIGVLELSRNFGHQVAITAGLEHASGEAVVVMDADLQDPPEVVLQMLERHRQGYDVVYGVREAREGESVFKRLTAATFYRLVRRLARVDLPPDSGDFRLVSRRVVEAMRRMPERNRYVRGMVAWAGYRQSALPYARAPRQAGRTKYPLGRMLRLAADAVVSFSTVPLHLAAALGGVLAVACVAFVGLALLAWAGFGATAPAWTIPTAAILFIGGLQLLCLGIIGAYVGRIHDEVKQRPLYLVGAVHRAEPRAGLRALPGNRRSQAPSATSCPRPRQGVPAQ